MTLTSEIVLSLKNTGKYWTVFTGDSIASCEWVHPNWRDILISVLQDEVTELLDGDWKTSEWGVKGFNFGYDGATTKDVVDRIDDILLLKSQLVIGLMGGNDPVLGVSVDDSVKNIQKIVDQTIKSGAKIVWCSSTSAGVDSKKNLEYEPYSEAFLKIPERKNFYKVDMFNIYQKFPTERFFTFKSEENLVEGIKAGEPDLQHPNQLGNAYIAKVILREVFGIEFDPEKYIKETLEGEKFPSYK